MDDALIGTIVEDRYLIEGALGAGAMGRVYRARHVKVGREVAIKVMRGDLACETRIVERFEREAQIAAQLHHPNVVAVLDVGKTPAGEHLMVMELAPGRALGELTGAPMPRARAVSLVAQLLRGLSHAHAAGLVHRDLKPDNVLVESDGKHDHARIVDFGIAVLRDREGTPAGRRLTDAGVVVGTPMYMAPEQASGKPIDHRADLFALGVMAYELLAGATPFEGTGAEVALANVTRDPPWIADRVRGVAIDPLLEAFVRKLMARRPADRFASAHDALVTLELLDRDRDAAARELDLVTRPSLEAPPAVLRLPRESDALSTQPMAEPDFTDVIVRAPRRPPWAVLAGAALLVATTIGWRLVQRPGTAAASTSLAALPAQRTMIELPEPPLPPAATTIAAPPVIAMVPAAPPQARFTQSAIAPAIGIAPPRIVPVAVAAPARAVPDVATASAAAPPAPARAAPATDESADALAARYQAIGSALRKAHGADELWQRYRLIQLGDAMATPASRAQALATLDAIARALPARS